MFLAATALWIFAMCSVNTTASAQGRPPIRCAAGDDKVTCTVDITRVFDDALKKRIRSGFTNTFLYRLYIRRSSDDEPVALTAWRAVQVYELWDELHYVYDGDKNSKKHAVSDDGALAKSIAIFENVLAADGLPPGRYYADLFVEVNPLSATEEAEIRSWIARSRGGHRTFAAGDRSFFGTFVSLFINIRPGSAERAFRFQTRAFEIALP